MKVRDIYNTLRASLSHDYMLTNTYIFRWESDFFAISKGGLVHEIEVKMSRGDFRADFKKIKKHQELQLALDGKKKFTVRKYLKYEFTYGTQVIKRIGHTSDFKAKQTERYSSLKELNTSIDFKPIFTPNRFYYACPKDLIKKSEIPKYAGLYYIDDSQNLKMIKQAPILHRTKHDFKAILLHKFYNLSLNQGETIRGLEFEVDRLRRFEGDIMGMAKEMEMQTEIVFDEL